MNFKKDTIMNTVGNFAYLGVMWLMSVLVVRLGNFEMAGYFSLALTTSNIYISIASYTARLYYAADIQGKYSDRQYFLMRIVTTLISFIMCVAGSAALGYSAYAMGVIVLFYVYKVFEMLSDILFGAMQRHGKLYYAGYSMVTKSVLSLIAFIAALVVMKDLLAAIIVIDIIALLIFCLVDLPIIKRLKVEVFPFRKGDAGKVKQLLWVCFPLLWVGICYNLIPSIPRLSFERLYSTEEYGIFSSLSTVTVLISTAVNCVVVPFIPKLTEMYQSGNRKTLVRAMAVMVGVVLAVGVLALAFSWLCGEWFLVLLFGPEVAEYMNVFYLVIIATVLTSVVICLNAFFTAAEQEKLLLYGCIVGVVSCTLLTVPLCKAFYMSGVAYNLIISQGLEIVLLAAFIWNICRKMPKQANAIKE